MQHVAADGHRQAVDVAEGAAHGEGVEQGLGRVLVLPVAGVDDAAADLLRQQRGRAGRAVADHQDVRLHGVQRHRGIDQGLALGDRRGARAHVDDVGAQPLAGQFERALGAGRGLEEQGDQGAALEQVDLLVHLAIEGDEAVGQVEQGGDLDRVEIGGAQEMAVREGEGRARELVDAGGERGHQSAVLGCAPRVAQPVQRALQDPGGGDLVDHLARGGARLTSASSISIRLTATLDSRSSQKAIGMSRSRSRLRAKARGRLAARPLAAVHVDRQADHQALGAARGHQLEQAAGVLGELRRAGSAPGARRSSASGRTPPPRWSSRRGRARPAARRGQGGFQVEQIVDRHLPSPPGRRTAEGRDEGLAAAQTP